MPLQKSRDTLPWIIILECRVGQLCEQGDATTKKEAKKKAAAQMFRRLEREGIEQVGAVNLV